MRTAALVGLLLLLADRAVAAPPVSAQVQRQRQEMKAKYDKDVAEMKRRGEQKWKQLKADQAKSNQQRQQEFSRELAARRPSAQLPPFNPAAAPPPVDCLRAFIAAAKAASSMEQVLPFLPVDEQEVLKQCQKQYDPKAAASKRIWFKQQDPQATEESLTYLTNPPFVNELNRNKDIANRILDVLSVKIEGDKALISVSTNSGGTFNGQYYPYGTAKVELVGEAAYWKLHSYNDSNTMYLHPPQPR